MDDFITVDQLKTFPGQLLAVLFLVQAVKATVPKIPTYWLRLASVVAAIGVNLSVSVYMGAGGWLATYLMAPLNGLVVALAAMKSSELIKGDQNGA